MQFSEKAAVRGLPKLIGQTERLNALSLPVFSFGLLQIDQAADKRRSARLRSAAAASGRRVGLALSQSIARLRLIGVTIFRHSRLPRLFDQIDSPARPTDLFGLEGS